MRSTFRPLNFPPFARFILSTLALVLLGFFLSRPFVDSANASAPYPRWLLLFAPVDDPTFGTFVWRGLDLPVEPATGERLVALGLGSVATLAILGIGSLVVFPFRRLLKTNVFETLSFQFGAGLALCQLYFLAAGLSGVADAPVLLPTLAFAAFFAISTLLATTRRFTARKIGRSSPPDADAASLFSLKTLSDRVFFAVLILLLSLFTSFYYFASTQPLFEYDVLEYHAQAAREIFETGALAFSANNVYSNMPLGAETLYLAGFNIVRDLVDSPEAPLRLGSLVGKVVLTNTAAATALGLFAFCVRFFRDGRAGLCAALLYLSFPSVFDVFANGLNDGVLGLALFSAFYAFLLSFAADSPRRPGPASRVATSAFIGVYVGLALAVKHTAVVFVFAPTLAALTVAPFVATRSRRRFRLDAQPVDSSTVATDDLSPDRPTRPTFAEIAAPLVVFVATCALVSGGWFARNVAATGNPFHPLTYAVFGDASQTWDADVDARWRRAHSPSASGFAAFADSTARSVWRSDLASPFFLFVPVAAFLALTVVFTRLSDVGAALAHSPRADAAVLNPSVRNALLFSSIAAVALVFWLVWHFATHRLTRFLVPIEPLIALLLGLTTSAAFVAASSPSTPSSTVPGTPERSSAPSSGRAFSAFAFYATLLLGLLYSGLVIDVRAPGRVAPLRALERDPARFPQAAIFFNDRPELFADDATHCQTSAYDATDKPAPTRKLLLVGEAKAFAYRVPVLYSTCWDRSPLLPLLGDSVERDADGKIVAIRDADAIRRRFRNEKIAFVLVDFAELARFRSPGNYGFRDAEIDENLFRLLTSANVLEPFALPQTPERPAPETTRIFRAVEPSDDATPVSAAPPTRF